MRRTRVQDGKGNQSDFNALDIIDFASELPEYRQKLITVHHQAIRKYQPEPYPMQVTLFRAKIRSLLNPDDPELGWLKLAPGRVTVIDIPSSHEGMFKEPYVQLMAEKLKLCIDKHSKELSSTLDGSRNLGSP
jgi:thioesterase domain-containing protein